MSSSGGLQIEDVEVVGMVLPIVATVVTSFRLFERIFQQRLWLDDAWAALATLFIIVLLVANWLYLRDYATYTQNTRIALYYLVAEVFYAVVWTSRLSILFTVVRMCVNGPLRTMLKFVGVTFLLVWMVLFAQVFWTCEAEPGWKTQARPQCDLGRNVAIAQIITDVFGDSILILAPFRLMYGVRLSRPQKIRILSIFSTSAITTIVSLTHAYYVLFNGGLKEATAAMVEASVGLIVANLSVVVAFLFRIGTEENATFSPPEMRSIVTFGSKPIRKRPDLSTTVIGVETTTLMLDDLPAYPTVAGSRTEIGKEDDVEIGSFHKLSKPTLLPDV